MQAVRTRDEAIASVDNALRVWSTEVAGVLSQAQAVTAAAISAAEACLRRCANEVTATEALLASASAEERGQAQSKLIWAKEAHEQARRALLRANDVATSLAQLARSHTTRSVPQVATANGQLSGMSRAIERYRAAGGVGLGGLGVGRSAPSTPGSSNRIQRMGLAEITVEATDLTETPILDDDPAAGTFGKGGLTRADYRWAVQTWNDVVGPGVAAGKTRDDFEERDARTNAKPLRRTAEVYDLFLGTDRIRVDRRPDGSLGVTNGRHRLLIAKELGITGLPGEMT